VKDFLQTYAKAIVAVAVAVLVAASAAFSDGQITRAEWIVVAIAFATAAQVFTAPNVPGARFTKSILAGLMALLTFLITALTDNTLTTAELVGATLLVAGALGVLVVPNRPPTGDVPVTAGGSAVVDRVGWPPASVTASSAGPVTVKPVAPPEHRPGVAYPGATSEQPIPGTTLQ